MVTDPNSVGNPNCNEYRRPFHKGLHSHQNHGWIGSAWSLFLRIWGHFWQNQNSELSLAPKVSRTTSLACWGLSFLDPNPKTLDSRRINFRCSHQVQLVLPGTWAYLIPLISSTKEREPPELSALLRWTGWVWDSDDTRLISVNLFKFLSLILITAHYEQDSRRSMLRTTTQHEPNAHRWQVVRNAWVS